MKKLVCPCCGWSDFLKYDDRETIYCLACGLEYSEEEVLGFETDVPDEDDNYGITVIGKCHGKNESFNGHRSEEYYQKWIDLADKSENPENEESELNTNKDGEDDWQTLDGSSPFDL